MNLFVSLDLETTWVNHASDKIIEYAFIKFDAHTFEEVDVLTGFVNPGIEIPDTIQQLTGISDADVRDAWIFLDIMPEIQEFINWYPLVWHNISFDVNFLKSSWVDVQNNPVIDTFLLANYLSIWVPSLSLWSLCTYYNISLDSAHRALDDTRACLHIFKKLIWLLQTQSRSHGEVLSYIYSKSMQVWDSLLYNIYMKPHISTERPSLDSLKSSHLNHLTVTQSYDYRDDNMTNEIQNTYHYLENFPCFEYRESQEMMSDIVDKMFTSDAKVAVEAPTWTWKTFSYLVSALRYAKTHNVQVWISTSTKVLQKQIYEKDLSFLKEHLPFHFTYTKLMWRKNYFSLREFYKYLALYDTFSQSEWSFFLKLYFWSISSELWEFQELDFFGEEFTHLRYLNTFSWDALSSLWELRGEFYLQARKNAETADIVLTNSSVVIQDIQGNNSIFWEIDSMIFDEAHTLEDVVTQACMKKLSSKYLEVLFGTLHRKLQKSQTYVNIPSDEILYKISEILSDCAQIASREVYYNPRYKKYLFKKHDIHNSSYLKNTAHTLLVQLKLCEDLLTQLEKKYYFTYEILELAAIQKIIWDFFIAPDFEIYIYMCDIQESGEVEISYTILHTWDYLSQYIWQQKRHVLLTSATLFNYTNTHFSDSLLGIKCFEKHILPQVFDYKKQVKVFIPKPWGVMDYERYMQHDFLYKLFIKIWWKWLMLCTSYKTLKELYIDLSPKLHTSGVSLIIQGFSGWKNKHIDTFLHNYQNSILVGTDSFWQWIDFPWDILEYLIIQKLPFSPPSDPIFKARAWLFSHWFYDYAIPKASIKLRQWFWRLIRSKNDSGSIVLMDTRIMTEKWWKLFLDSLPRDIHIFYHTSDKIIEMIDK